MSSKQYRTTAQQGDNDQKTLYAGPDRTLAFSIYSQLINVGVDITRMYEDDQLEHLFNQKPYPPEMQARVYPDKRR